MKLLEVQRLRPVKHSAAGPRTWQVESLTVRLEEEQGAAKLRSTQRAPRGLRGEEFGDALARNIHVLALLCKASRRDCQKEPIAWGSRATARYDDLAMTLTSRRCRLSQAYALADGTPRWRIMCRLV